LPGAANCTRTRSCPARRSKPPRLRQWLTNAGIAPQPYDLSTGLVAEIGTGSKLIALRADIDALPIESAAACRLAHSMPG
jgi:metal-dependent amidase/aminoacylase/carboxypeptidase family protein